MPKFGDYFESAWLRAEDLNGKDFTLTISGFGEGKLPDGKTQVYLEFKGTEKKLGVNRTNGNIIADVLGTDEMDDWVGKKITLYPTKTEFQGKRVACIRVRDDVPQQAARAAAPAQRAPIAEEIGDDSEIPF